MEVKKKLVLIDTHALAHRAFHAFPPDLGTKRGEKTNAIFGFSSMLLQVLSQFKPDYIVCALDYPAKTFRHKKYSEYKATRAKIDESLVIQIEKIKQLIESINIPAISIEGYEADDIIGSIVKDKKYNGFEKIIITGDRDLLQLIDDNINVYLTGGAFSKSKLYNKENVIEKFSVKSNLITDYKALRGDSSDNIPGVNGIGDKTASELINKYGDIDNIYNHINELKPNISKKLIDSKDIAYLSKELATISTDINIMLDLNNSEYTDINFEQAEKLFIYYEFRSLVGKLKSLINNSREVNSFNNDKPEFIAIKNVKEFIELLNNTKIKVINFSNTSNIFEKPQLIYLVNEFVVYSFDLHNYSEDIKKVLNNLVLSSSYYVYDSKRFGHCLLNLGIDKFHIKDDLMIMDYLLVGGGGKIDLQASVSRYLNIKVEQVEQQGLFEKDDGYTQSYHILLLSKALPKIFEERIKNDKEPNIGSLYSNIEKPLVNVLINIERDGIVLDIENLNKFKNKIGLSIKELEKKIFDLAGEEFNISSPKQLSSILFEKLKLPIGGKKNKSGGFSTNERILNNYINDYPIVEYILEYRELFKLNSTYTNALIDEVNKNTGRIHTSFNQNVVATGRLSSTNPNLQNIPINTELGQNIRKAFVSKSNNILISFDYSQQELRLLAHLSNEKNLIDAFNNKTDIHSVTASKLFNINLNDVSKNQRRIGKTINFGVIYGISSFGLSDRLKISNIEAQEFIDSFFKNYPRVKVYFEELKAEAKNRGYIESIMGRRRSAEGLYSSNYQLRQAAEREIINFPLQASAADIMKIAMIKCLDAINNKYKGEVKMILQVHDELIFEVFDDNTFISLFENDIKDIMSKVIKLNVPVIVESKKGYNWGELK